MSEIALAQTILLLILRDRAISSDQIIRALTAPQPTFIKGYREFTTKHLNKLSPEVSESVIEAFIESNQSQLPIETVYGQLPDFTVMDESQLKSIFEVQDRQGWNNFRQLHPKSVGIVTVSSPGFSFDRSQCIIELGQQRDFLWGHGVAYLYGKTSSGWTKLGKVGTWIS